MLAPLRSSLEGGCVTVRVGVASHPPHPQKRTRCARTPCGRCATCLLQLLHGAERSEWRARRDGGPAARRRNRARSASEGSASNRSEEPGKLLDVRVVTPADAPRSGRCEYGKRTRFADVGRREQTRVRTATRAVRSTVRGAARSFVMPARLIDTRASILTRRIGGNSRYLDARNRPNGQRHFARRLA